MFSIKIDKCNSPLPETLNLSALSVLSTFKATLVFISLSNLSLMTLLVTNFPLLPANGLSFT